MRTPSGATAASTAAIVAAVIVISAGAESSAAPAPLTAPGPAATGSQGDHDHGRIEDNRRGELAPTALQRRSATASGATTRWNTLGTPATLTARTEPLATGLPAEPVAAAEAYVAGHLDVLGLTAAAADSLELLTSAPLGEGAAVVFRQRFGDLVAGTDGLLSVGVRDGQVWYVSSSLARDVSAPAPATLTAADAQRLAAAHHGVVDPTVLGTKLVAVPTAAGPRAAWQVTFGAGLTGDAPEAWTTHVDARDGAVLVSESIVDAETDNPQWDVFPHSPPVDYSSRDTRVTWGGTTWDVDPATGTPTFTTRGNNAITVHNWTSNDPYSVGTETATPSPTRDYRYPWANQWHEESCNPAVFDSPERNDIDAARANLFAMHNRMHDWSYGLGFTEATWNMQQENGAAAGLDGDYEQGNAQAGGISGGPPGFEARNNANQITPPDGQPTTTNMYLWQPIAGAFYAPCVDGDYDMSVIAHEYTHAITNRMIAGPDAGLSSPQGMSESWSDLLAVEYLSEYGYLPKGANAFTVGQYVTGDPNAGIRNFNMTRSPLNYSHVDYDFVGLQVHASGELWSATNYDIRSAFVKRYGAGNAKLQKSCAEGKTPVTKCPGNRRWIQLVFDSFLLMATSANSQVDARDALLAADRVRFGGKNQDILWNAFAKRGLGETAASNGAGDANPAPGFTSPHAREATVTLRPVDETGKPVTGAKLFVGDYQARAVPVADTDPATTLADRVSLVPGKYTFLVQAPGYGHARVAATAVKAGKTTTLTVRLPRNLASATSGATATGDGINLARLIDDDEATNWASLGSAVAGKQVTVDLAGEAQRVRRVQVSALLRPAITTGDPDVGTQNRFSALRQFKVLACTATATVTCGDAASFRTVYTSGRDAFPSVAPRPRAPELLITSFDIPDVTATHLRVEVVTNQCTGAPDYAGEQDADPRAGTDCATASPQAQNVRIAEFQAFTR
ncbi:M36 family metallopeptidase [Actinoplanes sp. NBRC 101535]|uniref:M36 family metallopeptidase n=1 Tax=Actinoplanes sp. NBRC 101535 TaxID=3032196 RepID=UPI0024A2A431|nr:M36 family metallopeptidase [Actinoplanes sp. NBRC 101535]GLY00450.1 hypothetical protein Acsp01_08290 [Actinoplanes sp. NBRC 101535]